MNRLSTEKLNRVKRKPLIKESLMLLNICGMNPINRSLVTTVQNATVTIILIHVNVELILQFFFNWKGWESIEEFTVCTSLIQMTYKTVVILAKKKQFLKLLECLDEFWSWDDLDDIFRNKIEFISTLAIKAVKVFLTSCLTAVLAYSLKPLLTKGKTLPFDTYHPTDLKSSYYTPMYLLQVIDVVLGSFSVVSFDSLFLAFTVHIICELKIIKQRFSSIKIDPNGDEDDGFVLIEINQLIQHHNFLLKRINDVDTIYSTVLLTQFASSVTTICSGLISMIAIGFPPDLVHLMKYASFVSAALCQLFIYCLMGTFLMEQTQSVADAVYESKWWSKAQPKLRRACVLIIQRAQNTETLKAGGVFPLNLESFTTIVRFGLSFLTFAQGIYTRTTEQ